VRENLSNKSNFLKNLGELDKILRNYAYKFSFKTWFLFEMMLKVLRTFGDFSLALRKWMDRNEEKKKMQKNVSNVSLEDQ